MSSVSEEVADVLHTILDVLTGRRNLAGHEADALHETLTPGYTIPAPSQSELAAAQAVLDRAAAQAPAAPAAPAESEPASA